MMSSSFSSGFRFKVAGGIPRPPALSDSPALRANFKRGEQIVKGAYQNMECWRR